MHIRTAIAAIFAGLLLVAACSSSGDSSDQATDEADQSSEDGDGNGGDGGDIKYDGDDPGPTPPLPKLHRGRFSWQELVQ